MEPWSLVISTFTFLRRASWSTLKSADRLNHCSVSCLSASSSRATSYRMADSDLPCGNKAPQVKKNALMASGGMGFARAVVFHLLGPFSHRRAGGALLRSGKDTSRIPSHSDL